MYRPRSAHGHRPSAERPRPPVPKRHSIAPSFHTRRRGGACRAPGQKPVRSDPLAAPRGSPGSPQRKGSAPLATKAAETQHKGCVFSHNNGSGNTTQRQCLLPQQWQRQHNAKAVPLATKAAETQRKGSAFSHNKGSGNTTQRQCTFSHKGSGNTTQRQCL